MSPISMDTYATSLPSTFSISSRSGDKSSFISPLLQHEQQEHQCNSGEAVHAPFQIAVSLNAILLSK